MSPSKRKESDQASSDARERSADHLSPASTPTASKEAFDRASADARKRADDLYRADEQLKAARYKHENHYALEVRMLEEAGTQVLDRFNKLEEDKVESVNRDGDDDVSDEDLIEVNAGGKIIAARRGTLTQWKGTRLEALFSGRWDKKLLRDNDGRIFLDVNGDCFQAIVVYLTELASSTDDNPPEPPSVYEELEPMLAHQLELFEVVTPRMLDSNIVKTSSHANVLYDWLKEDGSDGEWDLIYRSSRDGKLHVDFHRHCDKKGPTLLLIETTEGGVLGGYTNTSWWTYCECVLRGNAQSKAKADKAFLFALAGFNLAFPHKMRLKNPDDGTAVQLQRDIIGISSLYGFGTGPDLVVDGNGTFVTVKTGSSYELGPRELTEGRRQYAIKEIEVFAITGSAPLGDARKETQRPIYSPAIKKFTGEINHTLNKKWEALYAFDAEVTQLDTRYNDEKHFIESVASGDTKDVVALNVSGTVMATKRVTLQIAEDSVLAQQFDDTKWTVQGSFPPVKAWTITEVAKWVSSIEGIPGDVASLFVENDIKGSELLALDRDGLKDIGVKRVGTICILIDEISALKREVSDGVVTQIEHDPYCFGKILDYLRLKQLHSVNLVKDPAPPTVRKSRKKTFEKIVDYYFPGDSSKFVLG